MGDPYEQLVAPESLIQRKGIELVWKVPDSGALDLSLGRTIVMNPELDFAQRFATLVHEVTHELLHKSDRRARTTKSLRETEAEAVAFALCSAIGMDSGNHSLTTFTFIKVTLKNLRPRLI